MNVLVLTFHPNLALSKVNRHLFDQVKQSKLPNLRIYDEYRLYPDEKIVVQQEQVALAWADRIVLQFPFYWYSCPPLLKKWEDQVLEHGWAYGSGGNKLHGKELLLAISAGAPKSKYQHDGEFGVTLPELLLPFRSTSNLIGTKFLSPFIVYNAMAISDTDLQAAGKAYCQYLSALGLDK
ncbi:NAD(P)H-dependent oxidoreductase [Lactobacillus sp. ESL0684]|uniref:NAD(P)H-dependent oxidoreductase n=1 Tax=Lactobacillus sp. ESL0684 TaxID=2983213 RepID=UPI0023F6DA76|nr:NAD(P)H-dependent oxidoreductase [Lactobacillus sp. ESL0684]WEV43973.1 NAD(P)H-dependent oxidoreductase [Lactobacillus sp. ESL0684]